MKEEAHFSDGLADSFKDDQLGKHRRCLSARTRSLVSAFSNTRVYVRESTCVAGRCVRGLQSEQENTGEKKKMRGWRCAGERGRGKKNEREGCWLFFCLRLQPVSLAHQPAPPHHSSSLPAPQPQTESPVTVLMAALYSLSPPHTPPTSPCPPLCPGWGPAVIDN